MTELLQVKELTREHWDRHWQQVHQANLTQSWQYGTAKEQAQGWRALRFLISDGNGRPVALAQVLTHTLAFFGGIARLNRGPLLLEVLPEEEATRTSLAVLQVLLGEARRRRWWIVQFAPELPDHEAVRQGLQKLGLRRQAAAAWASGLLDLGPEEQALLMRFKRDWRNCMRKGERRGVVVTHHQGNSSYQELLLRSYAGFQRSRGFKGFSDRMIRCLAGQQGQDWSFDLFAARDSNAPVGDDPIGFLVTTRHGDTATPIVTSTNDQGRKMQAYSVLHWQAMLHAKRSGCAWFDIGGLSAVTPKGIVNFKQGLNAAPYELVGEWRWYYWGRARVLA